MSTDPKKAPLALIQTSPFPKPAIEALRRGDRKGLIDALTDPEHPERLGERLANLAIELRRESVATIGSHEAFVRRTDSGDLLQVIRPVRLSIGEKTLYQMTMKRPFKRGTQEIAPRGWPDNDKDWRTVPVTPGTAELTYQGYMRVNAVAGCAVVQPPSVVVDGEKRTNPYVDRMKTATGRLGDIQRVVVGIAVVGPTPATGNPVCITYTLDYDPAKDLQHMLAQLAQDQPEECYLVDENDFEKKSGWKLTPLYGGVGFYYNLRHKDVVGIMADYVNLLQNAMKKASTVARRNAMRNHPALGIQSVSIDDNGVSVLPVIGWAGEREASDRWAALMAALARGQDVERQIESITIDEQSEIYDPAKHNDATETTVKVVPADAPPADGISPETAERNRLIASIDEGMTVLSPAQIVSLGYRPEGTVEELRATLSRLNAMADEDAVSPAGAK